MEKFGTTVIAIDDTHANVDALMERARTLLGFMDIEHAMSVLVESGVETGEAFLAVQAAKILAA